MAIRTDLSLHCALFTLADDCPPVAAMTTVTPLSRAFRRSRWPVAHIAVTMCGNEERGAELLSAFLRYESKRRVALNTPLIGLYESKRRLIFSSNWPFGSGFAQPWFGEEIVCILIGTLWICICNGLHKALNGLCEADFKTWDMTMSYLFWPNWKSWECRVQNVEFENTQRLKLSCDLFSRPSREWREIITR